MTGKATLMHGILAEGGISVVFQPVFEIRDGATRVFAIEALSRGPKGSNAERADVLFEYVRRKGKEADVDRACLRAALLRAHDVPHPVAISLNVHASTVERDDDFPQFLLSECAVNGIAPSAVILEIVEQQKYSDEVQFFGAIDRLRAEGVRIALDDIGLGYSNYRTVIELRPDFYKIDRYFVTGCKRKDSARAAIESIVLLADRLHGRVIAEGIESPDDLETVAGLGIDLVQGYHLARPDAAAWLALVH